MASSRAKGKRTELEAARDLSKVLGAPVRRNPGEQAQAGGVDLVGAPLRHFAVEVKAGDPPRWSEWLEQAEKQAGDEQVAVVMQWRPRQPWRVVVSLDLFQFAQYVKLTNALRGP